MEKYTAQEYRDALEVVSSLINKCETMKKIVEGTSQHTLLKNRITALTITKFM